MADSVTVKVEGLRELGERMRELAQEVNQRISNRAVSKAGQFIRDLAKVRAPVLPYDQMLEGVLVPSGNLRDNIVVKKVSKGQTNLTSEYIVTVRGKRKDAYAARYGRLVEYGTTYAAPHPFLRPAFDAGKNTAVEIIRDELDKGLERAAKKAAKG